MLPKNRRIPTPLLLLALKKSTNSFSEHLILKVHRLVEEDQTKPARITIITPAKVNPRAVDRHLSKRKISTCLGNSLKLIKPGQYLIFQVKKDLTKLEATILADEIRKLLNL